MNLTLFILFSVLLFSILGMHLLSGQYTPLNPSGPYGMNNGTLWGRLAGDGIYDIRKEGAEWRYGYDVPEFIRRGLIPRRNFEDFPRAFLLSFQIMTGDDWVNQMHDYLEARPGWITWFIFFANFGFCNFILLSLFIAVILENFEVAEAEKMEKQQSMRATKHRKAEELAKKPKVYMCHRLVWLCGGVKAGKKPKTLCSIGPDVEVYISEPFDVDDEDNGLLVAGDKWYNDDKSCFFFAPENTGRAALKKLAENPIFDFIVLMAIILGTVLLAIEGPPGSLGPEWVFLFDNINHILFLIFLLEFVSKVVGFGFAFTPKSYLKDTWNRLDFVVIIGTIINYLGGNAGFVRLLRCLRPLRIINRNEGMKVIISAVIDSLAVNVGVLALSGLGLLIFGILGVSLFGGVMWSCNCAYVYPPGVTPLTAVFGDDGGWLDLSTGIYNESYPIEVTTENDCVGDQREGGRYGIDPTLPDAISTCYWDNRPYNFDHVGAAMMSLFTASTLAGWTDIMEAGVDQAGIGMQPTPFNKFYFVVYFMTYVLVMAFFVTNLFIGVLIDFIGTNDGSALLTGEQQASIDTMKFAKLHRPTQERCAPDNWLRAWCWNLVESRCWEITSNGFIIFNVVVMMCEYEGQTVQWWVTLELMNLVCLIFFTVEMFFKLIGYFPREYISDPWHKFDAVVIVLSWAGILFNMGGAQAIRALRALRIVVVLKGAKGIRSLFQTLMLSVGPGINISVLLLLLYSVYAILGMMMFGNAPVQNVECMVESMPQDVGTAGFTTDAKDYCQIGMKPETCTNSVNVFTGELIAPDVNCTKGYVRGKGDTCKAVSCTLIPATYVDRKHWFSSFALGKPGQMLMGVNRQYTSHATFSNFPSALMLLFQCATGQDWKFVMYAVGGEPGQPEGMAGETFIYFGSFFFFSNYILLNLFVAVILDNFSASMRESELNVSEADFIAFKFKFRQYTTDKQPEVLLFLDLWKLMREIGGSEKPDEEGAVPGPSSGGPNALCPSSETWWNNEQEMAWALSCRDGAAPKDTKKFIKTVYNAANSPLKADGQPGISFKEYYKILMETPMVYESADQGEMSNDSLEWETFRAAPKESPCPSYSVIKSVAKTLRFVLQYKHICEELAFHGSAYNGAGSEINYDQLLQGLVNVDLGNEALSLEEQLHRGVASVSGFKSDAAQAEAELQEMEETELVWQRKLEYAKMNPSSTAAEIKTLEDELERIGWAKEEKLAIVNGDNGSDEDDDEINQIVTGEAVGMAELPQEVGLAEVTAAKEEAAAAAELAERLKESLATEMQRSEAAAVFQRKLEDQIEDLRRENAGLKGEEYVPLLNT